MCAVCKEIFVLLVSAFVVFISLVIVMDDLKHPNYSDLPHLNDLLLSRNEDLTVKADELLNSSSANYTQQMSAAIAASVVGGYLTRLTYTDLIFLIILWAAGLVFNKFANELTKRLHNFTSGSY